MNIKEARAAIEAILAAIDDEALPDFHKIEEDPERGPCVFTDKSHGFYITSGKDGNGNPVVTDYRARGSWHAIEAEMVQRATQAYYAEHPLGVSA